MNTLALLPQSLMLDLGSQFFIMLRGRGENVAGKTFSCNYFVIILRHKKLSFSDHKLGHLTASSFKNFLFMFCLLSNSSNPYALDLGRSFLFGD